MKGNPKCKNFRFEPHLGFIWLIGKRIVDFLLAIIVAFSLALTAAAL